MTMLLIRKEIKGVLIIPRLTIDLPDYLYKWLLDDRKQWIAKDIESRIIGILKSEKFVDEYINTDKPRTRQIEKNLHEIVFSKESSDDDIPF